MKRKDIERAVREFCDVVGRKLSHEEFEKEVSERMKRVQSAPRKEPTRKRELDANRRLFHRI